MHILIFCAQYFKFHCGVWFSVVCKDGNIVQNILLRNVKKLDSYKISKKDEGIEIDVFS